MTGPIARGDCELVRRQLAALSAADPQLAELYRALGRRAVDLAVRKGTISPESAAALGEALAGPVTSAGDAE